MKEMGPTTLVQIYDLEKLKGVQTRPGEGGSI